jgi:hypothetical protein
VTQDYLIKKKEQMKNYHFTYLFFNFVKFLIVKLDFRKLGKFLWISTIKNI